MCRRKKKMLKKVLKKMLIKMGKITKMRKLKIQQKKLQKLKKKNMLNSKIAITVPELMLTNFAVKLKLADADGAPYVA